MSTDVFSDRERMYAAALGRLDATRDAWVELGQPLLAEGSMGQQVEHPLVKLLRETEVLVLRLGEPLATKKHRGPAPKAVVSAAIGKAPSAGTRKLKAVGG